METIIATVIGTICFAIAGPVLGCLLEGIDRKISARMQGRVGPKIIQPYWDLRKLLEKDRVSVSTTEGAYLALMLFFAILAGGIFFSGGNLLFCVFVLTLSNLFFILAAYSTRSPYAEIGGARETLQVMSAEPMELLAAVAFFMATGSFDVSVVCGLGTPAVAGAWAALVGLLFILIIKFRKSPFDISSSHHAHQEIVQGVTTEMSGPGLAKVTLLHWCENILLLGWIAMFFINANPISWVVAVLVAAIAYFGDIWLDNNIARVKWQAMVASAWLVALVAGGVNVVVLALL